jgi:hypothetical protein
MFQLDRTAHHYAEIVRDRKNILCGAADRNAWLSSSPDVILQDFRGYLKQGVQAQNQ